jgi:ABC-type branched-subunit amino acid transport system ATPase component
VTALAEPILQLKDVTATYAGGAISALSSVSITVPQGSIVALLGANGAGKTTTVKVITGMLARAGGLRRSGTVEYGGRSIDGLRPSRLVGMGISQVMEGRRIFAELTVEENLRAGGWTCQSRQQRAAAFQHVLTLFPRLAERRTQRAGYLSGGEQQILAIARALMPAPKLLVLDEPSLGLAPLIVAQIAEIISQINAEGTSVVLIEQNTAMALHIAQYAYILEHGRIALEGTSESLRSNEAVRALYLGGGLGDSVAAAGALR